MNDKEIKLYEEKLKVVENLKNDIIQSLGYFKHVGAMLSELENLDIATARRLRRQVLECVEQKGFNNLLNDFETIKNQNDERIDYENSIKLRLSRKENNDEK